MQEQIYKINNIKSTIMNKIQIPWEDRPVGCTDVMWRYSQNPVIGRYHIPSSNSIFNSAVVPFEDGFAGVFRCDNKAVQMNIFAGFSKDGIHWDINHEPIQFKAGNTEMIESEYKYDPRVTWIEDRYWVTWCNGYHGPTIGIAYTFDFKEFFQCENAFLPFNRNGVLFPQKIDGKYAMLSRPSDNGHTPFGDIYISYSPDMKYWGEHRCVMKVTPFPESAWQCTKIGAGSVPFLTDEGWLLFYHGVITTCNGFCLFSFMAMSIVRLVSIRISTGLYPIYSAVNRFLSSFLTNENSPFIFVMVPIFVPLYVTLAPISGSPFSSVTLPLIMFF